jgi:PLD-like domain
MSITSPKGGTPRLLRLPNQDELDELFACFAAAEHEVLLVVPFISWEPVARLLGELGMGVGLTIVTDLSSRSVEGGSLDLNALRSVAAHPTGAVRHLEGLHAKAFCADWHDCFLGSANFTNSGLGFSGRGNHELVLWHSPAPCDVSPHLHTLLTLSTPVTTAYLDLAISAFELSPPTQAESHFKLPDLPLAQTDPQTPVRFLFQDLPFLDSPQDLVAGATGGAAVAHDRFIMGVRSDATIAECMERCRAQFLNIPVVAELANFLATPRRFGELSRWIHERCEDRPVPYRSEIKQLLGRTLHWLVTLHPDRFISVRPRHSEWFGTSTADWSKVGRGR